MYNLSVGGKKAKEVRDTLEIPCLSKSIMTYAVIGCGGSLADGFQSVHRISKFVDTQLCHM